MDKASLVPEEVLDDLFQLLANDDEEEEEEEEESILQQLVDPPQYDFRIKGIKFDSESTFGDLLLGDQNNQQFNSADCVEEIVDSTEEEEELQKAKPALINFDKIQKKTLMLVPFKHVMETLQQKSYLVSPLGPGKKVTGTGETVKGVFSSSGLLTLPSSSSPCSSSSPSVHSSKPSNHNVRKRPHNLILNTCYTSPKLIEPVSSKTSSIEDHHQSLLLNSNAPIVTRKKTKTHNDMERMRQLDVRNLFENLRKLVPILAKSPKCSKVEILKKAEEFIRSLRTFENEIVKDEQILEIKHQQLKLKLKQLNQQI